MEIKKIKNPKFLKNLKTNELEELSNDIRKYIIDFQQEYNNILKINVNNT